LKNITHDGVVIVASIGSLYLLCSSIQRGRKRARVVLIALNDGKGSVLLFGSPTVFAAAAISAAAAAGATTTAGNERRRRRRNRNKGDAPKKLKNFLREISGVNARSSKCPLGDG
jgi:hypothetical protein